MQRYAPWKRTHIAALVLLLALRHPTVARSLWLDPTLCACVGGGREGKRNWPKAVFASSSTNPMHTSSPCASAVLSGKHGFCHAGDTIGTPGSAPEMTAVVMRDGPTVSQACWAAGWHKDMQQYVTASVAAIESASATTGAQPSSKLLLVQTAPNQHDPRRTRHCCCCCIEE